MASLKCSVKAEAYNPVPMLGFLENHSKFRESLIPETVALVLWKLCIAMYTKHYKVGVITVLRSRIQPKSEYYSHNDQN